MRLLTLFLGLCFSGVLIYSQSWEAGKRGLSFAQEGLGVGIGCEAERSYRLSVSAKQGDFFVFRDRNLPSYNEVLRLSREGVLTLSGSRPSFVFRSSPSSYAPSLSLSYNDNAFSFSTFSYPGKYIPLRISTGDISLNCNALIVSGSISCKGKLKITQAEAETFKTKSLVVDMPNAADYVFADDYELKTLPEVEEFIKEHGHLPGVPSASDFSESGMDVSVMSNILLEKIEELTLHLIRIEKENIELRNEINKIKK